MVCPRGHRYVLIAYRSWRETVAALQMRQSVSHEWNLSDAEQESL